MVAAHAQDLYDEDGEELQWLATRMGLSTAKFLPCMLVKLFSRQIKHPLEVALHPFTRETLLMELLAAEHSDEELDDGELAMIMTADCAYNLTQKKIEHPLT
jgi:hypothetical protein